MLELTEGDDVGDRRVERDRRGSASARRDAPLVADQALGRVAPHGPSGTTADEIVDPLEAELLEPARGSRAEVSMLIEAVHDERFRPRVVVER